jgi:hypothetical protein
MKNINISDCDLISLNLIIEYILDNELSSFDECLDECTSEVIANHIYGHALKINKLLTSI